MALDHRLSNDLLMAAQTSGFSDEDMRSLQNAVPAPDYYGNSTFGMANSIYTNNTYDAFQAATLEMERQRVTAKANAEAESHRRWETLLTAKLIADFGVVRANKIRGRLRLDRGREVNSYNESLRVVYKKDKGRDFIVDIPLPTFDLDSIPDEVLYDCMNVASVALGMLDG